MAALTLDQINELRRRANRPALTLVQYREAAKQKPNDGTGMTDFLVGYLTGVPLPSTGGIAGALLHPGGVLTNTDPGFDRVVDPAPLVGGGGGYGGGGASSSYDPPSSSDSGGGSSDSGGSSGGDSGGGGGSTE